MSSDPQPPRQTSSEGWFLASLVIFVGLGAMIIKAAFWTLGALLRRNRSGAE